jgi:hypothetical protein
MTTTRLAAAKVCMAMPSVWWRRRDERSSLLRRRPPSFAFFAKARHGIGMDPSPKRTLEDRTAPVAQANGTCSNRQGAENFVPAISCYPCLLGRATKGRLCNCTFHRTGLADPLGSLFAGVRVLVAVAATACCLSPFPSSVGISSTCTHASMSVLHEDRSRQSLG